MPEVHILERAVDIPPGTPSRLRQIAEGKGYSIFNPDSKRLQRSIASGEAVVKGAKRALRREGLLCDGRRLTSPVAIHSLPGCQRQQWHTDYDPDEAAAASPPPMGVIVALEYGTYFETPERKYSLNPGDIAVFSGDTVHAGAAYEEHNTRIFFYLDTKESPRPRDLTWLIEDDGKDE